MKWLKDSVTALAARSSANKSRNGIHLGLPQRRLTSAGTGCSWRRYAYSKPQRGPLARQQALFDEAAVDRPICIHQEDYIEKSMQVDLPETCSKAKGVLRPEDEDKLDCKLLCTQPNANPTQYSHNDSHDAYCFRSVSDSFSKLTWSFKCSTVLTELLPRIKSRHNCTVKSFFCPVIDHSDSHDVLHRGQPLGDLLHAL